MRTKTIVKRGGTVTAFFIGAVSIGGAVLFTANLAYETHKDGVYVDPVKLAEVLASEHDKIFNKALGVKYNVSTTVKIIEKDEITPCGDTQGAAPYYCPQNRVIYFNMPFFKTVCDQLKACMKGVSHEVQFAYVLYHELAHHVQNVTGLMRERNETWARGDLSAFYKASVKVELQADCMTGFAMKQLPVRVSSALKNAGAEIANALGDDVISHGRILPAEYTHGTGAQRKSAFLTGFNANNLNSCKTKE